MEKYTLSYQLGLWVGKEIARFHLPTLSVDTIHGYREDNVIQVTEEEEQTVNQLDDEWYKSHGSESNDVSRKKFGKLLEYRHGLAKKYLDESLTVTIDYIDTSDLDLVEFRKGVSDSIWDCDYSWYVLKEENFIHSDSHTIVSFIELELNIGTNPYLCETVENFLYTCAQDGRENQDE